MVLVRARKPTWKYKDIAQLFSATSNAINTRAQTKANKAGGYNETRKRVITQLGASCTDERDRDHASNIEISYSKHSIN